jgi:hypothetical protein
MGGGGKTIVVRRFSVLASAIGRHAPLSTPRPPAEWFAGASETSQLVRFGPDPGTGRQIGIARAPGCSPNHKAD